MCFFIHTQKTGHKTHYREDGRNKRNAGTQNKYTLLVLFQLGDLSNFCYFNAVVDYHNVKWMRNYCQAFFLQSCNGIVKEMIYFSVPTKN